MDFFLGLLSCGRDKRSSRAPLCLPRFCLFRNQKHRPNTENPKAPDHPQPLKTASMTSRPLSQILPAPHRCLPAPQLLRHHRSLTLPAHSLNWGFLVGVVQADRCDLELLGRDRLAVQIGAGGEINSVGSMRSASLDHLVVFWKELAADFSLGELLTARQPLSLVFEDWNALLAVTAACQEELLKKLGEFCLKESESRICFNIITLENKYVLEFQNPQVFRQHLAALVSERAAVQLEPSRFELLLEKMALRDYLELKQGSNEADRKLQHFLKEIEREVAEESRRKADEKQAETIEIEDTLMSEPQAKSQSMRKSSNDYVQLEAQYFATHTGVKAQHRPQPVDEMLEIYYFNNQSNDESIPDQQRTPKKLNNFERKVRSRSEDATYVPDDHLDDEFFDRY